MTMFTFAVTFNGETEQGAAANLKTAIRSYAGYDGPLIIKNLKRMIHKEPTIERLMDRIKERENHETQ